MASLIESMHGMIHDINAQLSSISSSQCAQASGSSGRKKPRSEEDPMDIIPLTPTILRADTIVSNTSAASAFNGLFRPSSSGYNPLTLSSKSTESFIYDWYAKGLGVVNDKDVELKQSSWMSAVGSKVSTDNQGDAKSLMKLVEMLGSREQMVILRGPKLDAATDPAYGKWEISVRGICKILTTMTNDFLTMKEGKVGNAKTLTVGAMARRWKMQKFAVPNTEELEQLRDGVGKSQSQRSSTTSGSKAKSTILKSQKAKVTV